MIVTAHCLAQVARQHAVQFTPCFSSAESFLVFHGLAYGCVADDLGKSVLSPWAYHMSATPPLPSINAHQYMQPFHFCIFRTPTSHAVPDLV